MRCRGVLPIFQGPVMRFRGLVTIFRGVVIDFPGACNAIPRAGDDIPRGVADFPGACNAIPRAGDDIPRGVIDFPGACNAIPRAGDDIPRGAICQRDVMRCRAGGLCVSGGPAPLYSGGPEFRVESDEISRCCAMMILRRSMEVIMATATLRQILPPFLLETLRVRGFGFWKIPMIWYISPKVIALDQHRVVIQVPLNRRTRNHVGCMYIGTLVTGADIASGLLAMQLTAGPVRVVPIFRSIQAQFFKRAMGPVHFSCDEGGFIAELVQQAQDSGERTTGNVKVTATVPSIDPHDVVAEFQMEPVTQG